MANSWYVTKIEADRDGNPLRVFHRSGGPFADAGQKDSHKASKKWTHPIGEACEVCTK